MKRKFPEGERPSSSFQWMYHDDAVTRFLDERVNEQPKPALFVSHSGVQRQFAELLCRDLEAAKHSVFFDKESDSVAKGEESVASTLKAANECRLGILLLSEEFFTKSKWPMMELVTLVASRAANGKQAPVALGHVLEPRLLPVYYKLIRPAFKHPARQACWFRKWEEWAKEDPRIDVKIWKEALRAIDGHKSIDPQLLQLKGDDTFRREIVKRVAEFNIMTPLATVSPVAVRVTESISPAALPLAVNSTPVVLAGDGTRVVLPPEEIAVNGSIIRWCEGINGFFNTASDLTQKTGARVLGIHGMSGMGKSTLAKSLCKYYCEEFGGRVCHLELKSMVLLDLQKKVLQDLSLYRSQQILDGIADAVQAWNALEVGMKEQDKVFLVIDNIWDDQSFIAERFLKMKFAPGSKLLLIARSMPVLLRVGVPVNCCEKMLFLREEEAMALFINAGGCETNDEKDLANVRKWVSLCCFGLNNTNVNRFQYHPLAIKVLVTATTAAMGRKPSEWTDDILNFKFPNQSVNQVFEVLRLGFESLPSGYRPVFVSLILFAPGRDYASIRPRTGVHSVENICRWLAIVHDMGENRALAFLQAMEEKMVVEKWQDTSNDLRIHDLYREFAEHELLQGQYRASHVVLNNDKNIPEELKIEKPDSSQRRALYELSKELRVMKVENCSELKTLDLEYMTLLRYLVVEGCPKLEKIIGLKRILGNLAWLQWNCCNLFLVDVPLSSELLVLRLEGGYFYEGKGPQLDDFLVCKPPEVNLCKGMKELSLTKFPQLERAPELFNLICLETLIFNGCGRLKYIPDLSALSYCLRSLHLCGCASLQKIPGLETLTALLQLVLTGCSSLEMIPDLQHLKKLEFLDLSATGIREIPGIHALHELEELHLNSCKNLLKFPDLSSLHKLKKIFWRGCQVRRDGVMVSESAETSRGKRATVEEESDEDHASEKNSNSTDENSGEDSDGEDSNNDDDDEVESEHEDGEEEDAYENEEDEEGAEEDEEYADEDGDGDDENSTDTDSDADSG